MGYSGSPLVLVASHVLSADVAPVCSRPHIIRDSSSHVALTLLGRE